MTDPIPCPFCNASDPSDVYADRLQSDGRRWAVMCQATDCLAEGPHRATKREAIAAWNTRVAPPVKPLEAEVALLRRALGVSLRHHAPDLPGDSRAAPDWFVACAAVEAGLENDQTAAVLHAALGLTEGGE